MRSFYFLHLLPCSTLLFTESEDKLVTFGFFCFVLLIKKICQIYGNIYFKKKLDMSSYSHLEDHTLDIHYSFLHPFIHHIFI